MYLLAHEEGGQFVIKGIYAITPSDMWKKYTVTLLELD